MLERFFLSTSPLTVRRFGAVTLNHLGWVWRQRYKSAYGGPTSLPRSLEVIIQFTTCCRQDLTVSLFHVLVCPDAYLPFSQTDEQEAFRTLQPFGEISGVPSVDMISHA